MISAIHHADQFALARYIHDPKPFYLAYIFTSSGFHRPTLILPVTQLQTQAIEY